MIFHTRRTMGSSSNPPFDISSSSKPTYTSSSDHLRAVPQACCFIHSNFCLTEKTGNSSLGSSLGMYPFLRLPVRGLAHVSPSILGQGLNISTDVYCYYIWSRNLRKSLGKSIHNLLCFLFLDTFPLERASAALSADTTLFAVIAYCFVSNLS